MFAVLYRKIFFSISVVLVALSLLAVGVFGLPFGIDFTGGALTEVRYEGERPAKEVLENQLQNTALGGFSLRETGTDGYILRTRDLSNDEHQVVLQLLSQENTVSMTEERFNSIGPIIGEELRSKALVALALVVIVIILFVAFVFREVSQPVSSWKYGLIAIVALLHDIIIPVGLFSLLGHFAGAEIDVLFVMALLAILGYSVNDTIVVFDRVRENLRKNKDLNRKEEFSMTVGRSLNQTYMRSINTSITTVVVLLALFFLGPESTENFALVLLTGVLAGTYSSIFLASPLLVSIAKK